MKKKNIKKTQEYNGISSQGGKHLKPGYNVCLKIKSVRVSVFVRKPSINDYTLLAALDAAATTAVLTLRRSL